MHDVNDSRGLNPSDRRQFCTWLGTAFAWIAVETAGNSLLGAEVAAPQTGAELLTRDTRTTLAPGQIRDYRKAGNCFLVADAKGIFALSSLCTHAGCSVHTEEKGFGCPCHDSEYDLQGAVTQGPAKKPLKHFDVRESTPGGALVVDLSKTVAPDVRL
jgi:cytochrome b6-f complex iron-sulfur subunit